MNFNLTPADQLEIRRQGIAKAFGIDIQKADKPDGHWVTSEETGKHIFIGADGQPKYTREQIEGGSGSLGGVADEPGEDSKESLEDLKLQHLKLTNQALKTFPNSQKQLEVRSQIDKIGSKIKELESKDSKMTVSKLEDKSKEELLDLKKDKENAIKNPKTHPNVAKFHQEGLDKINKLLDSDKHKDKEDPKSETNKLDSNNSFEKKHGVSLDKLVKEINNPDYDDDHDLLEPFVRAGGKESDNDEDNIATTEDILNTLNKNDIKLKNKLHINGQEELESTNKPASKISKTGLSSLSSIVGKDDLRPERMGVFVDGNKLVATNAHKLVILNHNDPELSKKNGQVIDPKTGNKIEIGNSFPDYKRVMPKYTEYTEMPIEKLLDHTNGSIDAFKNVKTHSSPVLNLKFGDNITNVSSKLLLDTLQTLRSNGAKSIKIGSEGNRGIHIISDNGNEGLVMPLYEKGTWGSTKEFKIK